MDTNETPDESSPTESPSTESPRRLWWHRITGMIVILSTSFVTGLIIQWFESR